MKRRTKRFLGVAAASLILIGIHSAAQIPSSMINSAVVAADTQNIQSTLNTVLKRMSETVTEPQFGTIAGEWSVLCLARSGFYDKDSTYFSDYYNRIVDTVNEIAADNGALHNVKSTENARLILALSAIGRDAQSVGNYNLTQPFNDFHWIKKQGINGPIFALIALDTNDYQTADASIRQQCIDFILEKELEGGGWALSGNTPDADMTAMALQSLARYREIADVDSAIERGITVLSEMQNENGGFSSWGTVNSESIAQVITACTALGIDPDTDERFMKNGSAVDALLSFYDNSSEMFSHTLGDGGNAMATDQCSYALIAYLRDLNGENALYDMTDSFDNGQQNTASAVIENIASDNILHTEKNDLNNELITEEKSDNISTVQTGTTIMTTSIQSTITTFQSTITTSATTKVSKSTSVKAPVSADLNGDGIVNAQDILNAPNEKTANEIAEIFLHGKAAENK